MSRRTGCRRLLTRLVIIVFLLLVAAGAGLYFALVQSYKGFQDEVLLDIPRHTGTRAIADQLAKAGVIRYSWQFLVARAVRPGARLQAGEYRFTKGASVWTVYDRMVRGDIVYYDLSVPEGSNMFDIAAAIERLGVVRGDFLKEARNPALIHDLAPDAPTLEGYMFPSTYRLTRNVTVAQVCRMMTDTFRKKWQQLVAPGQSVDANKVVTMASLVEKETGVPHERPLVAAVFRNRLRIGMLLDCDPTTIYAALLEHRYRGTIYRSDLENPHKYNTYQHTGLPPGPIANPGVASLQAALHPADTTYLYFVAKGDGSGGHQFSTTIAEHNRAVSAYRRGQK
jgi:UPF0755 protein